MGLTSEILICRQKIRLGSRELTIQKGVKMGLNLLLTPYTFSIDQNGLLTIYPTFISCLFVAGIWMGMGISQQGIPHIVIYLTIVHKTRLQLNPLSKSKFLSNYQILNRHYFYHLYGGLPWFSQ